MSLESGRSHNETIVKERYVVSLHKQASKKSEHGLLKRIQTVLRFLYGAFRLAFSRTHCFQCICLKVFSNVLEQVLICDPETNFQSILFLCSLRLNLEFEI